MAYDGLMIRNRKTPAMMIERGTQFVCFEPTSAIIDELNLSDLSRVYMGSLAVETLSALPDIRFMWSAPKKFGAMIVNHKAVVTDFKVADFRGPYHCTHCTSSPQHLRRKAWISDTTMDKLPWLAECICTNSPLVWDLPMLQQLHRKGFNHAYPAPFDAQQQYAVIRRKLTSFNTQFIAEHSIDEFALAPALNAVLRVVAARLHLANPTTARSTARYQLTKMRSVKEEIEMKARTLTTLHQDKTNSIIVRMCINSVRSALVFRLEHSNEFTKLTHSNDSLWSLDDVLNKCTALVLRLCPWLEPAAIPRSVGYIFPNIKSHKPGIDLRWLTGASETVLSPATNLSSKLLRFLLTSFQHMCRQLTWETLAVWPLRKIKFFFAVETSADVIPNLPPFAQRLFKMDVERMYETVPHADLRLRLQHFITLAFAAERRELQYEAIVCYKPNYDRMYWSSPSAAQRDDTTIALPLDKCIDIVCDTISHAVVQCGDTFYVQNMGVAMGEHDSPEKAAVYLIDQEYCHVEKLVKQCQFHRAADMWHTYRKADDILSLCPRFNIEMNDMYDLGAIGIKDETMHGGMMATFCNMCVWISSDSRVAFSPYNAQEQKGITNIRFDSWRSTTPQTVLLASLSGALHSLHTTSSSLSMFIEHAAKEGARCVLKQVFPIRRVIQCYCTHIGRYSQRRLCPFDATQSRRAFTSALKSLIKAQSPNFFHIMKRKRNRGRCKSTNHTSTST